MVLTRAYPERRARRLGGLVHKNQSSTSSLHIKITQEICPYLSNFCLLSTYLKYTDFVKLYSVFHRLNTVQEETEKIMNSFPENIS